MGMYVSTKKKDNKTVMGYKSVKCWDSNSMGMKGHIKEGLELTPMGSFDIGQGGY